MTLGELRELTKDLPDDTEITFRASGELIGLENPEAELVTRNGETWVRITLDEY